MAFPFYRHSIKLCFFLLFCIVLLAPLPSCSFQRTKSHRTPRKSHEKFERWTHNYRNEEEKDRILWIDGNNVRGIGKFEWNAVELQHRVIRLCHKYKVSNAILVWDHGSHPFSCSTRYYFDHSGTEIPISATDTNIDDNTFCVNLLILFSGLRQRADDVIVKESKHLIASSFQDVFKSHMKIDWSSLAFVTNDRDLNFKLRRQSSTNFSSIRLSRRKRARSRNVNEYDTDDASTPTENKNPSVSGNPLFCDSTGFVDLLHELSGEYDMNLHGIDSDASEAIEQAKASIRWCSKSQRRGYNPRREKTWERCVQAETFRRILEEESSQLKEEEPPEIELRSMLEDENSLFIEKYLQELQIHRGYLKPVQEDKNIDNGVHRSPIEDQFSPFLGPTRLDKHQRRLLDRYNALVRKGDCENPS